MFAVTPVKGDEPRMETQSGTRAGQPTPGPRPPLGVRHAPRGARRARWVVPVLPTVALSMLAAGFAVRGLGRPELSTAVWLAGLTLTGAPLVVRTVRGMFRGNFASDVVATLAIVAAIALMEPLAGLVVVLMQSGGEALERYAEGRASDAVRALEADAPRIANRIIVNGVTTLEEILVDEIRVGDLLFVRPGEMIPCDVDVVDGRSHVDTSRLTGEPMPVATVPGTPLLSGSLNVDGPLTVRATAIAGESQYARIVSLVRSAQASKAPLQRLADRYAAWFTPFTLAACAVTFAISRDWTRVLAVLVVATPCPLILATPVAIIGGINKAARELVVVRHGGALEQLASVTAAVFDKTGTLTVGTPAVARIRTLGWLDSANVLRLAAGVEHSSGHLLARSVVSEAEVRGIAIPAATAVEESAGRGVRGIVEGRRVIVGARNLIEQYEPTAAPAFAVLGADPGLRSFVAIDGQAAAVIEYADQLRPGMPAFFTALERLGIRRLVLLSGDSAAHTRAVAADVGIPEALGDLLPEDKVRVVRDLVRSGTHVMMVGDGTNDAPALTTATVGIALAGHGGGIVAEAADIVVLGSDVTRVTTAIRVARRTLAIAKQSILVGLGLSGIAMVAAAAGSITPVAGAVLQEVIDVAVIVNALRTSR